MEEDSHESLATNVWNPLYRAAGPAGAITAGAVPGTVIAPVLDRWQRPDNTDKILSIQTYHANRDMIMSNPIVLAVKDPAPGGSNIRKNEINGNRQANTNFVSLDITRAVGHDEGLKPLLIIDGQHRLKGLNRGATINKMVPFILLYDDTDGDSIYTPEFIAETFATISTTPSNLSEPHLQWMQFTFGLPDTRYSLANPSLRKSFETGLWLGSQTSFGGNANTVYLNRVKFNPENPRFGYLSGANNFGWSINDISDDIEKYFFDLGGALTPEDLSRHISWATEALRAWDPNEGGDSKLFPGPDGGIAPLTKGVFQGLLQTIRVFELEGRLPANYTAWENLVRDKLVAPGKSAAQIRRLATGTDGVDWTFSAPGRMPGGSDTGSSQVNFTLKITRDCLKEYLVQNPGRMRYNFIDYLFGEGAEIEFISAYPTGRRRPAAANQYSRRFPVSPGGFASITRVARAAFNMQAGVRGAPYRQIILVKAATPNIIITTNDDPTYLSLATTGEASGLNRTGGFDVGGVAIVRPSAFGAGGTLTLEFGITNWTMLTQRRASKQVRI